MVVVVVVVYILNISLNKVVKDITPHEAWFFRKPNVKHLKVFVLMAFVVTNENSQGKMD